MTITRERASEPLSLITPELRALLIKDVRKSWPELTEEMGQRGVDQMVAFLVAGTHTPEPLTPSLRVDLFWHHFILRTHAYGEFCTAVAGGLIHHVPDDAGESDLLKGRAAMERSREAIAEAGFVVDPEFWPGAGAADCSGDCTQCHAGCSDSPVKK